MAPADEDDQDALAAELEASMGGGGDGDEQDALAAEWEAMMAGGAPGLAPPSPGGRPTTPRLQKE